MWKRLIVVFVIAGITVSIGVSSLAAITIKFADWKFLEPGRKEFFMKEILNPFMEQNPGIMVDPVGIPYSKWVDKLTVQFEAGSGPDLFMVQEAVFHNWLKGKFLVPLDDLLDLTQYEGKWLPVEDFAVVNGKTYMFVREMVVETLITNEALRRKAGVDVPRTPGELLQASEKIATLPDVAYGFIFPTALGNWSYQAWWSLAVIRAFGGRISIDGKFMVDDPHFIKGMDFQRAIYNSPGTPRDMEYGMQRQAFIAGKAGMCFDGAYWFSVVKEANPKVYSEMAAYSPPFPCRWTTGEINSMAINSNSSLQKQQAAAKLLQWFFTDEIQKKLAVYVSTPTGMKVSLEALAGAYDWYEPYVYQVNYGVPHVVEGYEVVTNVIFKRLVDYIAEVVTGRMSAQEACEKFQVELEGHFWVK